MSEEMKEYLGQVTERHGFYTRMAVPCRSESRQLPAYHLPSPTTTNRHFYNCNFVIIFSRCGEDTDLGSVHIVAREDIEHHPDLEKFRTYRNIREGGTAAYRRPSRVSLGGELELPQFSQGRQRRPRRVEERRSVGERLRDFLASRAAHSLYIWSPQDRWELGGS